MGNLKFSEVPSNFGCSCSGYNTTLFLPRIFFYKIGELFSFSLSKNAFLSIYALSLFFHLVEHFSLVILFLIFPPNITFLSFYVVSWSQTSSLEYWRSIEGCNYDHYHFPLFCPLGLNHFNSFSGNKEAKNNCMFFPIIFPR